jgi:hypothetical protein
MTGEQTFDGANGRAVHGLTLIAGTVSGESGEARLSAQSSSRAQPMCFDTDEGCLSDVSSVSLMLWDDGVRAVRAVLAARAAGTGLEDKVRAEGEGRPVWLPDRVWDDMLRGLPPADAPCWSEISAVLGPLDDAAFAEAVVRHQRWHLAEWEEDNDRAPTSSISICRVTSGLGAGREDRRFGYEGERSTAPSSRLGDVIAISRRRPS